MNSTRGPIGSHRRSRKLWKYGTDETIRSIHEFFAESKQAAHMHLRLRETFSNEPGSPVPLRGRSRHEGERVGGVDSPWQALLLSDRLSFSGVPADQRLQSVAHDTGWHAYALLRQNNAQDSYISSLADTERTHNHFRYQCESFREARRIPRPMTTA